MHCLRGERDFALGCAMQCRRCSACGLFTDGVLQRSSRCEWGVGILEIAEYSIMGNGWSMDLLLIVDVERTCLMS